MVLPLFELSLDGPEATRAFAARMASVLGPGDTLLLMGSIGAGKTHFARSLIQSILRVPEDVPSPTYTLIQTYDTTRGKVVHADLYRLSGPEEIFELGLIDMFGSQICLVEWPDRLGRDAPRNALTLRFKAGADQAVRRVTGVGDRETWLKRLEDFAHV